MKRGYGRDNGLICRMLLTSVLLGLVYVAFIGLLFWAGLQPVFILGISAALMLFQYFGSDKIVLKATGAKIVTEAEEPHFHGTVARLAAMADMPKPKKLAVMETHVPNAFATGRNPNNAVIAVTRGLMSRLDKREQEAVLAHELIHIRNRDVMILTWASLIVIAAGYLMQLLFWMGVFGGFGGGQRDRQGGGGNLFVVILAVYVGTILIYFISQMLIMTLSRYREYAADRGGSILTGAPLQLASALSKMTDDVYRIPEKDLRNVEHANAFFIVSAIKNGGMASLMSSHPPMDKRIQRLQDMARHLDE